MTFDFIKLIVLAIYSINNKIELIKYKEQKNQEQNMQDLFIQFRQLKNH